MGVAMTSDDQKPSPAQHAGTTAEPLRIHFEHTLFHKVDDIYFRIDEQSDDPVAVVTLGVETVILPLRGIMREFNLQDTPDGEMLELLAKSLKYVTALRMGDPVPSEILTREASWEPDARHKQIAYHRLAMQLLGWLSGDEHIITDPEELLQVAGDPTFRKKINDAFGEAAEALGLGRDNKEQVTHYIAALAHELSYIESMRDQFKQMQLIDVKIQELRRLYGNHRTVLEIADPCARLMERALSDFKILFDQADGQTGEIMAALRNIERERSYIQDMRDQLHIRLLAWKPILEKWHNQPVRRSQHAEELLEETYHFLAPRYMPVDQWVMMTKLQSPNHEADHSGVSSVEDQKVKKLGGEMSWF